MDTTNENINKIKSEILDAQWSLQKFKTSVKNKDVTVFLGNTRSGKSTLINFLIGTELDAFEKYRLFKIKTANENANGPKIGQGSVSCTSIPMVYKLNSGDIIIDTPGFDDNRGVAQDIINALYMNQLKHAKSARFVLVSDFNNILMDNRKGFTDLTEKVQELLGDCNNWMQSTSIIFCKDHRQYERNDLAKLLKDEILDVDGLNVNKTLVSYFVAHPDVIGSFRMPTHPGRLTQEVDYEVLTSISNSQRIELCGSNFKATYSDKSHIILLKIYQQYLDNHLFKNELRKMIASFNEYFKIDKYVFASTNDELRDTENSMKRILDSLESEIVQPIHSLEDIKSSFEKLNLNVSNVLKFLVNIDCSCLMKPNEKNKFIQQFKYALQALIEDVRRLRKKIMVEIKDRQDLKSQLDVALGGAAGSAAVAGGGFGTMAYIGSKMMSVSGIVGLLGVVGILFSAAAVGATVDQENNKNSERLEFRRKQNRFIPSNMFED